MLAGLCITVLYWCDVNACVMDESYDTYYFLSVALHKTDQNFKLLAEAYWDTAIK